MAELCRKCFIETWHPNQHDIDHIVMSKDNDFCEGCMDCGPYVDHIADGWCPECGSELRCMCVISADKSGHGREERLLHCENCLCDWIDIDGEELQRKFWG